MEININGKKVNWKVEKIGVIGPGIVGMPMAALLANAEIRIGSDYPAKVVVVQRNSKTSGWKVDSINRGESVIGGIEPALDEIVKANVVKGLLSASFDFNDLSDADVILVSVQTDKKGIEPDYGPMFGALHSLAEALVKKPESKIPLIIFESTLAPSSMQTVMKDHFAKYNLIEGKDILLGNSPNRVMPGRLVERVKSSDKLVGGLHPETPNLIEKIYSHIVTDGVLFKTNSLTAEIEKTFENAYRDVRIAFSAEVVRYCDEHNIDYYKVREEVNKKLSQMDAASSDPNAVPTGGLLIPTIGVGGHCLPKDGVLLWWRKLEQGCDTSKSLILKSREINDVSPAISISHVEKSFGNIDRKRIALLGAAYRFNSEDTRNSPTLELGRLLLEKKCDVVIHDPYVKPDDQNILKYNLQDHFTNSIDESVNGADVVIICTTHKKYLDLFEENPEIFRKANGVYDGCHLISKDKASELGIQYAGIGKGINNPDITFIEFVLEGFEMMEKGVANEVLDLIKFFNERYAETDFNKANYSEVQKLAKTCSTGCELASPGKTNTMPEYKDFSSELLKCSLQ